MKRLSVLFAVILALAGAFSLYGCSCGGESTPRTAYEITCELSNEYVLTGSMTVDFYNHADNAYSELKFNLFGNAFRKDAKYKPISAQYQAAAYPNGESYGGMTINSVTQNGEPIEFSVGGLDENILIVPLKKEVYPAERAKVCVEYTLSLANVIARTGYNQDTVNLANFYPALCGIDDNGFYECVYYANGDPFFSDVADYEVTLTADSEYVVAGAGELISATTADGKSTLNYKLNNARSFNFVLSKKFESVTDDSAGVKINYYYYADENPKKSLDYAVKSVKLFNEKFGEYPYSTYNVVQTKFVQGGMEYPTLVMISDSLKEPSYGEVIVHETAHQWWQTVVGNNEIEHGFLDEGLAEYSVVIFYENHPEYNLTRQALIMSSERTYKAFCSVYDKLFGGVDTTMLRAIPEYGSEYEYVNIAYVKACIMHEYLRNSIGDELFFKGLKRYYEDYKFKNATPYDLVGSYEKTGGSANGFFDSFFEGKVII